MPTISHGEDAEDVRQKLNWKLGEVCDARDFDIDLTGNNSSRTALNLALQQATDAQVDLWCPNGNYIIDGVTSGANNAHLGITAPSGYTGLPRTVSIIGQSRGVWDFVNNVFVSGTVFNATSATATGSRPALFSATPFVTVSSANYTTAFKDIGFQCDRLSVVLPSNPTFSALMLANAVRMNIGSDVGLYAATTAGSFVEPTTAGATAIYSPQVLNNVHLQIGACHIAGFYDGVNAGEHTCFSPRTHIGLCKRAVVVGLQSHLIEGSLAIENCNEFIVATADAVNPVLRLVLQLEMPSGSPWYALTHGVNDPSNKFRGKIEYAAHNLGAGDTSFPFTGGGDLDYLNLRATTGVNHNV